MRKPYIDRKFGIDEFSAAIIPSPEENALVVKTETPVAIAEPASDLAKSDFDVARQNILNVIDQSNDAVVMAFEIARDREDARSIDALNNLLKTVVSSSTELLEIHKKLKDLEGGSRKAESAPQSTTNIQNAVFAGTANDLEQLVTKMREAKRS